MTFENTAWAINGALLGSSLARRAEYAAVGGAEGIVQKSDLKVTQLAVPGVGILINAGVGLVNNGYQTTPNETYVVSNPSTHTFLTTDLGTSASARSYLVVIAIGDPDFTQTGHPFMGADDPPVGTEQSFTYVRPVLIQAANSSVTTLDVNYPALVLARIDIPANTTTLTDAMITDLRSLARPRQSQEIFVSANVYSGSPRVIPSGSAYADWGSAEFSPAVTIPTWAVRAIVVANVNGVRITDTSVNIMGGMRAQLGSVSGPATLFDVPLGSGAIRENLMTAGEYDVTGIAGTSVNLRVEGYQNVPATPTANQKPTLRYGTQVIYDVRFFEE